ncbi:MAG TPA: NAD(P)/FAD-dependent oxidoreductase, partial [Ferrovibrio sp.]|uniref:NAD(P)/FAD-dependent oxidoreductase n=1 Tax=Ferrovibrio sp. TaxID=1917215 RepID=UPI002B4B34FF
AWSDPFRSRHAGAPLKSIAVSFNDQRVRSEAMITEAGIEGGAIYALSAALREAIERDGSALLRIDLRPDLDPETVAKRLNGPRRGASLANYLRRQLGLSPVAIGLVQEALHAGETGPLQDLVKALPLRLTAPFDIARAISTAGGIALNEIDGHLMLRKRPGVFVAGEMLDWEAPTGGYLLQGCMATGVAAGKGLLRWVGAGS